jgi:hypothetical protein
MELSEGASHLMGSTIIFQSGLQHNRFVIFENKDRYVLGANVLRAASRYSEVHYGARINTWYSLREVKR